MSGYKKTHFYVEDHADAAKILERVGHVVVMVQGSYRREESEAHITWQYQQETWTLKGFPRIDQKKRARNMGMGIEPDGTRHIHTSCRDQDHNGRH